MLLTDYIRENDKQSDTSEITKNSLKNEQIYMKGHKSSFKTKY